MFNICWDATLKDKQMLHPSVELKTGHFQQTLQTLCFGKGSLLPNSDTFISGEETKDASYLGSPVIRGDIKKHPETDTG